MFCTNCGKQIEDDAIYCNYCGYKTWDISKQEVKETIPTPEQEVKETIPTPEQEVKDIIPIREQEVKDIIPIPEQEVKDIIPIPEQEIKETIPEKINDGPIDMKKMSKGLYLLLSIIGTVASLANMIRFFIRGEGDINNIIGQTIFFLIFIVSTILLLKSKKIGGKILISFALFKMASSLYYYYGIHQEYLMKNLIADEIFYLAIILLLIVNWETLK